MKEQLSSTCWGKEIVKGLSEPDEIFQGNKGDIVSKTTGIFSSTLGTLANTFIVLVTALFLASDPKLYIKGFLKLFLPPTANQKAVSLPPALTLFWQILFGTFLGGIGLFFATPLLAVILVFIDELYVKDYIKNKAMPIY